jgi:hypothetical protein
MTFNVKLTSEQLEALTGPAQGIADSLVSLAAVVDQNATSIKQNAAILDELRGIRRILTNAFRPDTPKILGIGPMTQIEENGVMKFQFPLLVGPATDPADVAKRTLSVSLDGVECPAVSLDPAVNYDDSQTVTRITAAKGVTVVAVVTDEDASENPAASPSFSYVVEDKVPPAVPGGVQGIGTVTQVGDDVADGVG